jgi:chromosome segregation ATPase
MGKKKELQAKLTEADDALHHLESTRAALSLELRAEREALRAERERHAEETATLRREHEQALDEMRRSTQEAMARAGEQLAEARVALEKATEENSRLTADLRDRDDRARTLLQELEGGVEAARGQLSGALTRIRDAAPHEADRYRSLEHTQGP